MKTISPSKPKVLLQPLQTPSTPIKVWVVSVSDDNGVRPLSAMIPSFKTALLYAVNQCDKLDAVLVVNKDIEYAGRC